MSSTETARNGTRGPAWETALLAPAEGWSPLVLTPQSRPSRNDFLAGVRKRRGWIQKTLIEHGALLFRDFLPGSAADLEDFTSAAGLGLMDCLRGNTPRSKVRGRVYTSTELPAFLPVPPHCEMSYTSRFPTQIAFICETPPQEGGRTPLRDMAAVYQAIPEKVRTKFETLGVTYVQSMPAKRTPLWKGTWMEMFETDSRTRVEAVCADQGIEPRWRLTGALELRSTRPAVIDHPATGVRSWFNHAHVFHPFFASELHRSGQKLKGAGARLGEALLGRGGLSRLLRHDVEYGDGTPIPASDIEPVRDALWQGIVSFPWQSGDVVLVDNLRIAHSRLPFKGKRRILAALIDQTPETSDVEQTAH